MRERSAFVLRAKAVHSDDHSHLMAREVVSSWKCGNEWLGSEEDLSLNQCSVDVTKTQWRST